MITPLRNTNPGIVPPWITKPAPPAAQNPGIVPPWLTKPAKPGEKNPGIVPPWLVDVPRILPVTPQPPAATTAFVRDSVDYSPSTLIDAIRTH
jgi:hypothetical protein